MNEMKQFLDLNFEIISITLHSKSKSKKHFVILFHKIS